VTTNEVQQFVYRSFLKAGADRLVWKVDGARLRILCYHGVCEDRLASAPWLPSFFVTRSRFEMQLRYLRDHMNVLPLHEAVQRLQKGDLPPRPVSITFDDGYANNLEVAVPLLRKYGMPATIFLSTAYMQSGEFFPFLKLKLIRLATGVGGKDTLPDYKSSPLDRVVEGIGRRFEDVRLSADTR
jgi:hypothetical protein